MWLDLFCNCCRNGPRGTLKTYLREVLIFFSLERSTVNLRSRQLRLFQFLCFTEGVF